MVNLLTARNLNRETPVGSVGGCFHDSQVFIPLAKQFRQLLFHLTGWLQLPVFAQCELQAIQRGLVVGIEARRYLQVLDLFAAVATAICTSSLATALPVTGPVCGGVRSEIGISRMAVPDVRMYASAIFATASRPRDCAGAARLMSDSSVRSGAESPAC